MSDNLEPETSDGDEGSSARQVARVYAEALLDVAEKRELTEQVAEELDGIIGELFKQSPDVENSLSSPVIQKSAKAPIIEKAFRSKVSDVVVNFLLVLNSKNRLSLLSHIAPAYRHLMDIRAKRVRVLVRSVLPLSAEQTERLRQTVGVAYGREPVIVSQLDETLLGGMVVQVGDEVFDSSVRTRVNNLRNQLLARSSYEIQVGRDRFSTAG
ncbi:ATP synthase F1 subunit delta [Zavarzinella formosa]|uniref:ATP synthase F1 subunit delta n=1 Tax=Zavarzinella formosa TaxID=360055 RepID=UPI00031E5AE1|nr:ATP synthase F1 subunit delta [Zavarzinella formosa]